MWLIFFLLFLFLFLVFLSLSVHYKNIEKFVSDDKIHLRVQEAAVLSGWVPLDFA